MLREKQGYTAILTISTHSRRLRFKENKEIRNKEIHLEMAQG